MNRTIQNKTAIALYFATIFTLLSTNMYAVAPTTTESKKNLSIITISGNQVMTNSATGNAIQAKLQDEQKKLTAPLQAEEGKIQKLEKDLMASKDSLEKDFAELDKSAKMLSNEAREQKSEALRDRALKFEDKKRELDRLIQKFQADAGKIEKRISDLYQKEMSKLDNLVKETIKEMAQKHNWDIVMMEESVVYASPSVSKTSMIIEALDKKAKEASQAKKQALEKEAPKSTVGSVKAEKAAKEDEASSY